MSFISIPSPLQQALDKTCFKAIVSKTENTNTQMVRDLCMHHDVH